MASAQLPLAALPAWQALNDVRVRSDVRVAAVPGKGFGLVAGSGAVLPGTGPAGPETEATATAAAPPLMAVPRSLVLHAEAVEDYAKQDRNFRLLLDAVERRSPRGDVVLFLAVQLVLARGRARAGGGQPDGPAVALSTPWTEYVRFLLAAAAPLPTLWTDAERALLRGTSLEAALEAKRWALEHEFDALRARSSALPVWQAALWADGQHDAGAGNADDDRLRLRDWVLADAWYRSRCLGLPHAGPAMVPCIDMANHSAAPTAYYEEAGPETGSEGEVLLLAWPQEEKTVASQTMPAPSEITIDYTGGDRSKPAAEMLFSYGFIDPQAASRSLALPFHALPDDPLAQAKLHVFGIAPRVEIALRPRPGGGGDGAGAGGSDKNGDDNDDDDDNNNEEVHWRCPFAHLACVNEEDGLDFRLRQETDGATQLRVFWQDEDVTDRIEHADGTGDGDNDGDGGFAALTRNHPLAPILRLRVVTVVQQVVEEHLERMQQAAAAAEAATGRASEGHAPEDVDMDDDGDDTAVRSDVAAQAGLLRDLESRILSRTLEELEAERAGLLTNPTVVEYLESTAVAESDHSDDEKHDDDAADGDDAQEEDFS